MELSLRGGLADTVYRDDEAISSTKRRDCFGVDDGDGGCGWVHPTTAIATTPRNDIVQEKVWNFRIDSKFTKEITKPTLKIKTQFPRFAPGRS
jgi:hypothetical protein